MTDGSGDASRPITGSAFILLYKQPQDTAAASNALKFFAWAYAKSGEIAENLDYVPMPANVIAAIQKERAGQTKDISGKPIF